MTSLELKTNSFKRDILYLLMNISRKGRGRGVPKIIKKRINALKRVREKLFRFYRHMALITLSLMENLNPRKKG